MGFGVFFNSSFVRSILPYVHKSILRVRSFEQPLRYKRVTNWQLSDRLRTTGYQVTRAPGALHLPVYSRAPMPEFHLNVDPVSRSTIRIIYQFALFWF